MVFAAGNVRWDLIQLAEAVDWSFAHQVIFENLIV